MCVGLVKALYCLISFGLNLVYLLYNVVIDGIETHNLSKLALMLPSTYSEKMSIAYGLMIVSTVFSALRCVGKIYVKGYESYNLVPDENYHIIPYKCSGRWPAICGKNFECGRPSFNNCDTVDKHGRRLFDKLRYHEIAGQIVGYLMLIEDLFQTGIVYSGFICKPQAEWLSNKDKMFEAICLVDLMILVPFTFISYLYSHEGTCNHCEGCGGCMCECDYPSRCRCVLVMLAWIAVIAAIPALVLLYISSYLNKQCGFRLARG